MSYPSCNELINLDATCDAIKRVGGVTARVWIAKKRVLIDDNTTLHVSFDNPKNELPANVWTLNYATTIPFLLTYFEGVQLKNSGNFEITAGENVNAFTHNLNLVFFNYTQEELEKLKLLMLDEDMVVIILTESGLFKVYGLDYDSNYQLLTKQGMKPISGTGADIVDFQGEVGVNIQLQATNMITPPMILECMYSLENSDVLTSVEDIVNTLNVLTTLNA